MRRILINWVSEGLVLFSFSLYFILFVYAFLFLLMSVLLSCILGICSFHLNLDDIFSYHCSSCIRFHGVGGTHNLTLLSAPQFLCYFGPCCSYVLVHASFLHICISVGSTPRNRLAWSLQYHHLKIFNWHGHTSFPWDCPQLTFPTAISEMPIFPLLHQTRCY